MQSGASCGRSVYHWHKSRSGHSYVCMVKQRFHRPSPLIYHAQTKRHNSKPPGSSLIKWTDGPPLSPANSIPNPKMSAPPYLGCEQLTKEQFMANLDRDRATNGPPCISRQDGHSSLTSSSSAKPSVVSPKASQFTSSSAPQTTAQSQ